MRTISDVIYEEVIGYRPLRADLYVPERTRGPSPVVIWLHGGGWALGGPREGDSSLFGSWPRVLAGLAARGFVVMAVEYRFSGEARFPAQIQDAKAAVRWIRTNARAYGADPSRIYAWGGSAGGYLAVLLGTSCGVSALEPASVSGPPIPGAPRVHSNPHLSDCVQGVIDWYGPIDFARLDAESPPGAPFKHDSPDGPESTLLGCALPRCPRELLRAADPLTYIAKDTPPFLIMQGTGDRAVPFHQSEDLYGALRARRVPALLIAVRGADHGFAGAPLRLRAPLLEEVSAWLRHPGGSGLRTLR